MKIIIIYTLYCLITFLSTLDLPVYTSLTQSKPYFLDPGITQTTSVTTTDSCFLAHFAPSEKLGAVGTFPMFRILLTGAVTMLIEISSDGNIYISGTRNTGYISNNGYIYGLHTPGVITATITTTTGADFVDSRIGDNVYGIFTVGSDALACTDITYGQPVTIANPTGIDIGTMPAVVVTSITNPIGVSSIANPINVNNIINPVEVSAITNPVTIASVTNPVTISTITNPVTVSSITNAVTVQSVNNPVTISNINTPPIVQRIIEPPTILGITNPVNVNVLGSITSTVNVGPVDNPLTTDTPTNIYRFTIVSNSAVVRHLNTNLPCQDINIAPRTQLSAILAATPRDNYVGLMVVLFIDSTNPLNKKSYLLTNNAIYDEFANFKGTLTAATLGSVSSGIINLCIFSLDNVNIPDNTPLGTVFLR